MKRHYTTLLWCLPCCLLFVAGPAAAEIYTWTDDQGTVHYSDKPVDKARPADLPALQSLDKAQVTRESSDSTTASAPAATFEAALLRPLPDETFRDARGLVAVRAAIQPALTGNQQLIYYLDGAPTPSSPTRATALQLSGVERGEHQLSVAVVAGERELARSAPVTFYAKPPSTLGPTSQSDAAPPDQQPAGATTAPPTVRSPGTPAAPRFGTSTGVAGP